MARRRESFAEAKGDIELEAAYRLQLLLKLGCILGGFQRIQLVSLIFQQLFLIIIHFESFPYR
jgi:hypothetical protein